MFKVATAVAALAFAVPGAAQAAYQIDSYAWAPGALSGNISYAPTALSLNVGIGRFQLNGTDLETGLAANFITYCIDIFHELRPALYDFAPIATLLPSAEKQGQLLTLLSFADPLVASSPDQNEAAAAVQLAIWEITNETGETYGFSTGAFQSSGGNSDGARALAQSYLDNVTSGAWAPAEGQLQLFYSRESQSQILAAVPEPATWAMMLGGIAFVGMAARRRNRPVVAFA
jgi:hypothetical protein